jgi:hypothetical protein
MSLPALTLNINKTNSSHPVSFKISPKQMLSLMDVTTNRTTNAQKQEFGWLQTHAFFSIP